jgi:hypothetical protein
MAEGVSYEIGVQRAREKQAERGNNPTDIRQLLLDCVAIRDAMRATAKDGNLEETLANHLDGFLSVWD